MAAKKEGEAYRHFTDLLQGAISCVSRSHVLLIQHQESPYLALSESPTPLGRNRNVQFDMAHSVEAVRSREGRGWTIRTISYTYWLYDADGTELIAYQWEPAGRSPVKTPHIHIGKVLSSSDVPAHVRRRFSRLASAHLPTGFIPVTDILRTTIRDFGVEPLRRLTHDATGIDWDGIDRVFRAAQFAIRASFAEHERKDDQS